MKLRFRSATATAIGAAVAVAFAGWANPASSLAAPLPVTPVYSATFQDAVTGDLAATRVTGAGGPAFVSQGNGGQFAASGGGTLHWDVDQFQPGSLTQRADDYHASLYERPTDQIFSEINSAAGQRRFGLGQAPGGGSAYHQYLDVVSAKAGFDGDWLYVQIDLFGENRVGNTQTAVNGAGIATGTFMGLQDGTDYGFRIGKGPAGAEARSGFLVTSTDPSASGNVALGTYGVNVKTQVIADQSDGQGLPGPGGDVGGASITPAVGSTKEGTPSESGGNGYDVQVVADGKTNGSGGFTNNQNVLYTRRLVDTAPENGTASDNSIIEFAFDYKFFGFTEADLMSPDFFLMMFSTKGLTAPANIFWNDEYNFSEAGTPNSDQRGLAGPNSSFQTTGTQNIYQLDTVRAGAVPEPSSGVLLGAGATMAVLRCRRRRRP